MTSRSYTSTTSMDNHLRGSLHTLFSLPNELIHFIIEYTAYTYELVTTSHSPLKHASPELLALSVANRQLRRFCLPFLFAKLVLWLGDSEENVQQARLKDEFVHLMKFTKILVIRYITQSEDDNLSQIISQFKQLSHVILRLSGRNRDVINLLKTILAHPPVSSVRIEGLPDESLCNHDLSKVVLNYTALSRALSPEFGEYFNRGMRLRSLELRKEQSLDTQFGFVTLPGVEEISIFDYTQPDSLSWLPLLSSTNPTLNQLWLLNSRPSYVERHGIVRVALPFFPFINKSQRQDLDKSLVIKEIGLHRTIAPVPLEWHVTTLSFTAANAARTSLIETLELVALLFPKLEMLILNLDGHEGMYDVGDLVSAYTHLSCLRVVEFHNIFRRLKFGSEVDTFDTLIPPAQRVDKTDAAACVTSGLLAFASCLAKQVRTLDSVYINDYHCLSPRNSTTTPLWDIAGWLHVLNGNRDIGGTLV
ncbi:hypothetical protein FB446DRAFT_727295 [Lentinula raphanica]|nr:hypothetical protein FB446DRAFT_727295 [Lentinula raphanica]